MKIQIILSILIGAVICIGRSQQITNDSPCTDTGTGCPETRCCNSKFRCQFTLPISLFSLPPELYEQAAERKVWKCLDRIPLFQDCQFHEECSHVEHAKCYNLKCQCDNNYVGTADNKCVPWNTYNGYTGQSRIYN